jgi:AcrR family transcriptional regulator
MIADAAGVSIGLIQHHFDTKADLIHAVDDHVITIIDEAMAAPVPPPPGDPIGPMGQRVNSLIADHPDVVDYLARALTDGNPVGVVIFDRVVAMGTARWDQFRENHRTRPDLDPTWAALNPIILAVGAIILRPHLDRHLSDPFSTSTQLRRWENAVNDLLRAGQLRSRQQPGDSG